MIKSTKGLFVLSVITAILMVVNTCSYIEFTGNAGFFTQEYIQTKRDR